MSVDSLHAVIMRKPGIKYSAAYVDMYKRALALETLLIAAKDKLEHGPCFEDDATKCPGCALEAEIEEALR